MLWINSTFETEQCDTSEFSRKNPRNWKNIFFKFFPSPNAGHEPTYQSCSNSIYSILLQIFLAIIFVFDLPLKLRVVHIRNNYKISIFSKMAPSKLIKFCGFTVHSKPNNVTPSAFPEKIPETEIKNLTSLCDRRLTERLTQLTNLIQFRYLGPPCKYLNSLFFFIFDLLLKLRVDHIRKIKHLDFLKKRLQRF